MTRHLLFQLSDLHLLEDPAGRLRSGATPLENLDRAIETILSSTAVPDAVVLSGDLSDDGSPQAYRVLSERLSALEERTSARIIVAPGNHDDRQAFRQYLLGDEPSDEPLADVVWLDGLRVITLDTTIPGSDGGSLAAGQLDWLKGELEAPAPLGTVLVLHHPPIPSPIATMSAIALEDPAALADAIAGSDVAVILAGHNHHATAGMLGPDAGLGLPGRLLPCRRDERDGVPRPSRECLQSPRHGRRAPDGERRTRRRRPGGPKPWQQPSNRSRGMIPPSPEAGV